MTTPRSPHEDNDFRQLTGSFDRPIAPSPRFAEELKARLKKETVARQANTVTARPVSQRTARASSSPTMTRRRWLDIAIAAALIVAMLGGSLWYADVRVGDDGPGVPRATRYAAQPLSSTPIAAANPIQSGDPGNVNAWPAGFDPGVELEMSSLFEAVSDPSYSVIAADTIIISGRLSHPETSEEQGIAAIDIETGAVRWWASLTARREFVTNGTTIFGFFSERGQTDVTLMAIDVEHGQSRWRGPSFEGEEQADLLAPVETMNLFGPTLVDQYLFFRTPEGEIISLNAQTGEEHWSLASEETVDAEQTTPGSLVSDGQYVYEIDMERSLRKISLEDGTVVERIEPELEEDEFLSWIYATEQELLIVSKTRGSDPQHILAVSPETGETLWSKPLGEVRPYITATRDVVAVAHYVPDSLVGALDGEFDETGLYISYFDLGSGALTSLQRPSTGDFGTLSSSGDVVCINQGNAVSCTDMATRPQTLVTLPYAPGEGTYDPVMFHGDAAIIRGGERGLMMVQPKDPQPQQAMMLPGDPGQTSAWSGTFDISGPLTAREMERYPGYAASGTIVGNILIAENKRLAHEDPPTFSGTGIYAQDLTTGEILWRNTDQVHQRYTADASGVYIVPHPVTNIQRLIALDLETGEARWTSDPLSTFSSFPDAEGVLHAGTPVAIEGTVYVPMVDGVVLALDGATGEVVWTYEPMAVTLTNGDATIAGDDDHIYAIAGDNVITVLDRQSGALVQEFVLEGMSPSNYSLWPHVQGDRLIVQARANNGDDPQGILIAVDPDSGEETWRQETDFMQSNVLVTSAVVGVIHGSVDYPNRIERFFGQETRTTTGLSLYDLRSGEPLTVPEGILTPVNNVTSAALASSGETICVSYINVTCFDRLGNITIIDGYETPHYTNVGQELLFWHGQLVILNPLVPNHLASPGQSPVATPIASPVFATPITATPFGTP